MHEIKIISTLLKVKRIYFEKWWSLTVVDIRKMFEHFSLC